MRDPTAADAPRSERVARTWKKLFCGVGFRRRFSGSSAARHLTMQDAQKDSAMNRWLWIGSLAGLLVVSTGCLRHQTRGGCSTGNCNSGACNTEACSSGACSTGTCPNGTCGGKGLLGKLNGGGCNHCVGGRTGCVAGPLGWQQGGHDYSSHLQPGALGHRASHAITSQPFTPGPPTGQVAYPYYTVRGPRDFLQNDPPTIGR